MPSIKDRLKKLPPFEEDIPMMKEIKEIAKHQTTAPQIQEPKEESPQITVDTPLPPPTEEVTPPEAQETTPPPEEEKKEEVKEEVSERTAEQIDKLKEHNQQLKEENKQLYKDVLSSLRPDEPIPPMQEFTPQVSQQVDRVTKELPQDKVDDIYANLIDKDGYIDPDLLIKTLRQANEEAKKAREEAENARKEAQDARQETKRTKRDFEENQDTREVHAKYPQIDPKSDKFNEFFWDDVRKEIATAPYLKGASPTFMQAADAIWEARYKDKEGEEVSEEVKKAEKQKIEEAENAKRNINASEGIGRSKDYYAQSDIEALKAATISGKRGALAERLKRAGQ